jgi:3-oxoadipate enol-lactonase
MPETQADGARIWYAVDGRDDAPPLLLLHSLGTTHELWDQEMPAFRDSYRVIRFDMRGHGRSTAPPGEYTIERLGHDAIAVLDAAGVTSASVCGVSIGGVTSIWLAQNATSRVQRLVLANTAARIGTSESWSARIRLVRESGMKGAAELAIPRWFTDEFRARRPDIIARYYAMVLECPAESYMGACAALRDADLRRDLHRITTRTLVVAGRADASTTVGDGEHLRDNIPDARLEVLEAAHLSNVERPVEFTGLVREFLSD